MRLKFNILCFEDDSEYLDPILEALEDHLDEQGFYLKRAGTYKNSEYLDQIVHKVNEKKLDVDLILMDYYLSNNEKGNTLIENIRDHNLLTDIIFYSQDTTFRKDIELLDGVYITDRAFLRDKVITVTDHILKKTLDLSNLRGLVMAETSELDELIHQIILTFLEGDFFNDPVKEKESIKRKVRKNLDDRLKKLDKIKFDAGSASDTRKFISDLESSLKARTLQDLTGEFIENAKKDSINSAKYRDIAEKLSTNRFVYDSYNKEVQRDRNKLGHLKEFTDENGKKILKPTREGEDAFEFDEKKALEIRKNLKKYYEMLSGIYETISGEKWD
jgi:hypothetical protein